MIALSVSLYRSVRFVVERRVLFVASGGSQVVTVVVSRDCRGVECPASGNPSFDTCLGGECVDPRCTPETPGFCPPPRCDDPSDCVGASCVTPICVSGVCLLDADHTLCGSHEYCDGTIGCVPVLVEYDGGMDAGTDSCVAVETSCADGVDDDCDGLIDCADSDCASESCNGFGSLCDERFTCHCPTGETEERCANGMDDDCDGLVDCMDTSCGDQTCDELGRSCNASGQCACPGGDVETACTDGADNDCDGLFDCADPDCGGVGCDDGVFCNGADVCDEGICMPVGGPACSQMCDEAGRRCFECSANGQCGSVTRSAWSACAYDGGCDETGTRSRTLRTPICTGSGSGAGSCSIRTTTESGSCNRDTDGNGCGGTSRCFRGSCHWRCSTGNDGSVTCGTLCGWCEGSCGGSVGRDDGVIRSCGVAGGISQDCYCR